MNEPSSQPSCEENSHILSSANKKEFLSSIYEKASEEHISKALSKCNGDIYYTIEELGKLKETDF